MLAVIKTGGKQYQVKQGDVLSIEKLPDNQDGDKVVFDQVLLLIDDKDNVTMGDPIVKSAKVEAKLIRNYKDKKVTVIKYKAKTRYKKTVGHRQHQAEIKIEKIVA
ncbi:50S ribosomal protein L21 [bacterium]|jgi:large subunit ribosomal protein L21|nr:50S ribosomal protein L21 [bacterium]MBT4649134.1 50S ribosomal protein L21 [bacterium]